MDSPKFAAQLASLSEIIFVVLMLLMVQTEQIYAQCTGIECQEECECPKNESPPCSIVGLVVANVIVATPLLLVYLLVPAVCCVYSCRSKDVDKPPTIVPGPPSFDDINHTRHESQETQTSDSEDIDDSCSDDDMFELQPGDKGYERDKNNRHDVKLEHFHIVEDETQCYSNVLLDLEEQETKH
ncbi:uncharacterized protein [Amphiura filiformis]|uniref:uncharacterized protein n=1 Tax=Amphiura filiformis TaxID=82378 RepID=UPI003B2245E2